MIDQQLYCVSIRLIYIYKCQAVSMQRAEIQLVLTVDCQIRILGGRRLHDLLNL